LASSAFRAPSHSTRDTIPGRFIVMVLPGTLQRSAGIDLANSAPPRRISAPWPLH
jgi:hypothetical protein